MLFNEPKLLKFLRCSARQYCLLVSVLFNEPKLLKSGGAVQQRRRSRCFSALQRAEIAEMTNSRSAHVRMMSFSALQRAEIAEISAFKQSRAIHCRVSVLFNEPKLLKLVYCWCFNIYIESFSALQRAEIAEMGMIRTGNCAASDQLFQCSSTSRNC